MLIFHKISDITKIFQRGTKKCDFRNKSKTGEDPKKVRGVSLDSSQISQTSDTLDDTFTKNFNSLYCVTISEESGI